MKISQSSTAREVYDPPSDLVRRITQAGGLNRWSGPNFRLIWGWSRLDKVYGKWEGETDKHGNLLPLWVGWRTVPRYPANKLNRWVVEAWVPPEKYGAPELWPVAELGPFPSRGDYEHVLTLETPKGEFTPLTSQICDDVVRLVEASRHITHGERREYLLNHEQKKEDDWDKRADAILSDHPRWWMRPHVGYTGAGSPHMFGNENE